MIKNGYLKLDSVELVKTSPRARLSKAFEEFTHRLVIEAIRTVEHHTL